VAVKARSGHGDRADSGVAGHPFLRDALVSFAREDPFHAARLLAGLLPAQGAFLDTEIDYDVTIRELGSFAVTVAGGHASVRSLRRPRSRRDAEIHIAAHALTLAELLAGRPQRVGRFLAPLRVRGSRRRLAALGALAEAGPTLAQVARAGARLDCNLVMRLLPYVIPSAWTGDHFFTILHELSDQPASDWYVTVAGPAGLSVRPMPPATPVDARVTMTAGTFDRLLRGEAPTRAEKPWIRGDLAAVRALSDWIQQATH
jgi:hypothetical protein